MVRALVATDRQKQLESLRLRGQGIGAEGLTLLAGWPYGAIYRSSTERTAALTGWLDWYNTRRPHGALSHKPPIARLNELNNLLRSYI